MTAVEDALAHIESFPETGVPSAAGTRTCILKQFPFGIVYRISADEIDVVAVAHFSREPDYWLNRLTEHE